MHGGDHKIPMPCGETIRYQFHMRYGGTIRVIFQGDHKSHIRHEDTSHAGGPYIHVEGHTIPVPYKVRGNHKIPIPFKVWGTIRVISYMWGTICTLGGTIQYLFHLRYGGP